MSNSVILWAATCQASGSFTVSQSSLKFMSSVVVMLSNLLILCHPLLLCLQYFPDSGSFPMTQIFSSGGQSIGASASASVLPMNIPGLVSFRIDWFDLLTVQWVLKSPPAPQFKSINSLTLSLPYGPTLIFIHGY